MTARHTTTRPRDAIRDAFLHRQLVEGTALAEDSPLLDLQPVEGDPPDRYLARFSCTGLVRTEAGITRANDFLVGISFPEDYLREVDPFRVVTLLWPRNLFHPNASNWAPLICLGRIIPGTGIVDLLFQIFEILTWNKVNMREDDALQPAACAWARNHPTAFPVDHRPLKRRLLSLDIRPA